MLEQLEHLSERIESMLDRYDKYRGISDPPCTSDLLCDKKRWHKCEYRPVATSTYIRGLREAA